MQFLILLCFFNFQFDESSRKKLSDKGIVQSENTIVRSLVTKEEADRQASDELLERTCHGNVPAFLATFLKDRKLSKKDIAHITKIIEDAGKHD